MNTWTGFVLPMVNVAVFIVLAISSLHYRDRIAHLERYKWELQQQVRDLCAAIPPLKIKDLTTENGAQIEIKSTVACEPVKEDQ